MQTGIGEKDLLRIRRPGRCVVVCRMIEHDFSRRREPVLSFDVRRYSPDLSLKYEMDFPSGDHAGSRSAEPLEFVRLRTSPFSAGMVNISPRASTTTRLPVGEIAMFVRRLLTSSHFGIIQGKSPAAVIFTMRSLPVFGSSS